jgi:CRISPR-associated protein Cas1
MIKRTIEISREPAHLKVRQGQLVLSRGGQTIGQVPCEDLGMVVVDHPQTTYSHAALAEVAATGAVLVVCGHDHLPVAALLPLADHTQVVWRLRDQLAVKRPLRKQLWRQLVVAKVRGQARNLLPGGAPRKKLFALAREVKSGDPTNIEAQAAKIYWSNWLDGTVSDASFRRDADGDGLNAFLNYGYAIARAALARAIVAAGLQPSIGLHHHNRSNAFCLADDLIEPFRPLVDDCVRELHAAGYESLTQEAKAQLLNLLVTPLELAGQTGPWMVMVHRLVASLVKCFAGETRRLEIPRPVVSQPCKSTDIE